MRKNWLLIGIALLVAVLAIGGVACGGDGSNGTGGEADPDLPVFPDTVIVFAGVLADPNGNTLYVFEDDEVGESNCVDACARTWPPLTVSGDVSAGDGVGTLGTIKRDNGIKQVTHNDQPLYYYSLDVGVGDQSGDGVNDGAWHMVVIDSTD